MPSSPASSSFPYGAIKRHVRNVLNVVSVKRQRIASLLLGVSTILPHILSCKKKTKIGTKLAWWNSRTPLPSGRAIGPRPSPCVARIWSWSPPSSSPSSKRIRGRRNPPANSFSQGVRKTPEPVRPPSFPQLLFKQRFKQKLTHTPIATPTPHSRQPLPPSSPP